MSAAHVVERDAPRTEHAPIDPNVKLPPGVLASVARAEAAHKAAYDASAAGADPQAAQPGAPVTRAFAAAPPPGMQQAPAPQPAPVAPQAPGVDALAQYAPPKPAAPAAPDDTEHRFRSQQGRLQAMDRNMRQMQDQMVEMGNQLTAAHQTIASLRANQQPRQSLITDDDRTAFGDDWLDVAARAAQDRLLPEVHAAREEARLTRQELHEIKVGRVYDALAQQVGANWRDVNRHPAFIAWLGSTDPMSGAIRRQLLDAAMQAANAARVVSIFRGFLAEDAASRPAPAAPQSQPAPATPAAGQRQPAVDLLSMAAPGRASAAPGTPTAAEKPTYVHADFSKFADDVRRGKYAGRDAERMAIEADMHASQFDGRLRPF